MNQPKPGLDPEKAAVISGRVEPRTDGHLPGRQMSIGQARACQRPQVQSFADSASDMVTAVTITYPIEAIGIVQPATDTEVPWPLP